MRKPRVHVCGGIYHVMLRGNNGQRVFNHFQDEERFFHIVENVLSKCDGKIHAYCLMPNHIHLVVEVCADTISKIMQFIASRYVQYFNKQYKRKGHLFQARFKSLLVHADKYFLILIRYIHQNPLRAKLIKSLNQSWPSSFCDYCGLSEAPWLTQELVLSYFKDKNKSPRDQFYEFMRRTQNKDEYLQLFDINNLPEHKILVDFTKTTYVSDNKCRVSSLCTIDDILLFCENTLQVSREHLNSQSQQHNVARARMIAISLAFITKTATLKELSIRFEKNYFYLSRQVNQLISKHYEQIVDLKRRLYEYYKS